MGAISNPTWVWRCVRALIFISFSIFFLFAFTCSFIAPGEFTDHDVEVFRRYLTFCGIGIQNAQLFEMSIQEYRRNQILLNLARSIFEEQNNLECLVTKILTEARGLLKCKRCAVFLLDLDCCESVSVRLFFFSISHFMIVVVVVFVGIFTNLVFLIAIEQR